MAATQKSQKGRLSAARLTEETFRRHNGPKTPPKPWRGQQFGGVAQRQADNVYTLSKAAQRAIEKKPA